MFDEVHDGDRGGQVKIWDNELTTYHPGDIVPDTIRAPYSVRLQEGGFANVSENRVFSGITDAPEHPKVISKWGGPADEQNPVAAVVSELWADLDGRLDDTVGRLSAREVHRHLIERFHDGDAVDGLQALDCPFYVPLEGTLGADWGVVVNPMSSKFGRLVFEHDDCGCPSGPGGKVHGVGDQLPDGWRVGRRLEICTTCRSIISHHTAT